METSLKKTIWPREDSNLSRRYQSTDMLYDGLEDTACLLTDTGDTGSSPHVARWFFSMMFHDKILLYI